MKEREFLRWIRSRLGRRNGRILVDSGDDAAVVRMRTRAVLFKTDAIIDGVHFKSREAKPEDVGHKAIARALSDIAAMGCHASSAVIAMAIPKKMDERYLKRVFEGMNRTAGEFDVDIVGGDVASHSGRLSITVSLLGEVRGRVKPLRRSGARAGDCILVTGDLGGSIRGKHLTFTPRLREGIRLNRDFRIRAMIDISDGLVVDLTHICEESGVGADLQSERIPISASAKSMRGSPLKHALFDGEDYELLFTAAPKEARRIEKARIGQAIGTIQRGSGVKLDGRPLPVRGWEHQWKS